MDEPTETALRGSIEKWEKIVALTGCDEGTSNCPLCLRFHGHFIGSPGNVARSPRSACDGCPVAVATGKPRCSDSPHDQFQEFTEESGIDLADHDDLIDILNEDDETKSEYIRLAKAELDFLKSLLPTTEVKEGNVPKHNNDMDAA